MEHSQLAIVGLNCFFNQPFNSQIFSAFIYNGKTIKDADINHLDYPLQSPHDSFSVLSKVAHQALEDCKINSHKKVAVITNNSADTLAKHLSNLGNFSAISFSLDAEKDCLLKALEISQILLTAKEVDTVIISVVNSDLNTNNLNAGAIVIKDYRVAQQDGDRIYAVLQSFTRIADTLYPSSTAIQQSCQQALQQAKIHPSDIGYIEVSNEDIEGEHSPEFLGLINAYAAAKHDLTCAVGSVKANLGDLGIAAGVISLIKTALSWISHKG